MHSRRGRSDPLSPWDVLSWHTILDGHGKPVGEAYVAIRVERNHKELQELGPVERALFNMYDTEGTGLLGPGDFLALLADLKQVHGDVDTLAGRKSNPGCIGLLVGLPETDLVGFIKFNHTLSNIFVGNQPGQHWTEGLGGVELTVLGRAGIVLLTMLFSLTVNVFVELYLSPDYLSGLPSVKVFLKTFIDVIGCGLIKKVLLLANLSCIPAFCRSVIVFLIVSTLILVPSIIMTRNLSGDQSNIVLSTFLAMWFLARITEIFHLGTLWAFKVSYGSTVGCAVI